MSDAPFAPPPSITPLRVVALEAAVRVHQRVGGGSHHFPPSVDSATVLATAERFLDWLTTSSEPARASDYGFVLGDLDG